MAALASVNVEARVKPAHPTKDLDVLLRAESDQAAALESWRAAAVEWRPADSNQAQGCAKSDGPHHLTDLGNAERFRDQHSGAAVFDVRAGCWRVWTGKVWRRDETGEVMRLAHKTARSIYREAAAAKDSKVAEALGHHAARSESRDRLKAMVELAQSLMTLEPGRWDSDNWVLNANNGTIDLRTGELRPHARMDYITRISPVNYGMGARSELWERVLNEALPDLATIGYFQRAAVYSMTGDTREEKLFLVIGPEATGKSTVIEAIRAAAGDYAMTANFESFTKRVGDGGVRNDIARLQGARFVSGSEVDEGRGLAEALVKNLTGGETVTARFLYREEFEFQPTFKLWLGCNHAPRVKDDDGAMWRRIVRLPFERTIPKGKRDPTVKARLKDPLDGGPAVLAWLVAGCLAWQTQGLGESPAVEAATAAYRADQDPLKGFFEDCCVFVPHARVAVKELREAYESWAHDVGEKMNYLLSPKAFAERLKARGCESIYFNRARGWQDIGLRASDGATDATDSNTFFVTSHHERELGKVTETAVASVASVAAVDIPAFIDRLAGAGVILKLDENRLVVIGRPIDADVALIDLHHDAIKEALVDDHLPY
ncbi:MAG: phage/plasmid primase, P4 family [bacterium]|nr:phage/plasmid primase, P4 family [bacterium]